jgi:hypothetical protein
MSWNEGVRQTHRWVAIAFTVGFLFNGVAVARNQYANWMGLLVGIPLLVLQITGLYLFFLPYVVKWRRGRRTA